MSLQYLKNVVPSTNVDCIFRWKQFFKSHGYTVPRSSDGLTYFPSSDGITSSSSGAGGLNNNHAWFVLQEPSGGAFQYLFLIPAVASNTFWYTKFSPAAGFTGGSPSATVPPSATDELKTNGCTGTDAAPMMTYPLFGMNDGTYTIHMAADPVYPFNWYMTGAKVGGDYGFNAMPLAMWTEALTNVVSNTPPPRPTLHMIANTVSIYTDRGNPYPFPAITPAAGGWSASGLTWSVGTAPGSVDSPATVPGLIFPLAWFQYGSYVDGVGSLVQGINGGNSGTRPKSYSVHTPRDYMQFGGGYLFPWDGSAINDENGPYQAVSYFVVRPPTSSGAPDLDVANFLAAQSLGLTLGSNMFVGPVRPVVAAANMPPTAVFVLSTPGPEPLKYFGPSSAGSVNMGMIQVRVRSAPGVFDVAQALTRSIRDTLHRNVITGYFLVSARQSQPEYLGQDKQGNEEFSINFDLWCVTTP